MASRKLTVEIVGDASSLNRALRTSSRNAKGFEGDMNKLARGAIAGSGVFNGLGRSIAFASSTFLGAAGLVSAIRSGYDELKNMQVATARTNNVIKTTGGVAGVTREHVLALSKALLQKSGVDDEAIQSGQNLLLTFTNVRNVVGQGNDVFDRATKAALDLSVATGRDLDGAVRMLGRSLQDPIKGMDALRRTGVVFTEQERDQIKKLAEHGHILEAQKAILAGVEQRYKGAAEAAGGTFGGQLKKLQENVRNMEADLLKGTIPAIEGVTKALGDWLGKTKNQKRIQEEVQTATAAVSSVLRDLKNIYDGWAPKINDAADALGGWNEVFKIAFSAFAIKKVNDMTKAIGTAEGTGLLGSLFSLKKMGPIKIVIGLKIIDQLTHNAITNWMFKDERNPIVFLANKINKLLGLPTAKQAIEGTAGAAGSVSVGANAGAVGQKVSGYAKTHGVGSGTVYNWGGVSPVTGYDCSGFLYAAYASAGVKIPRDTRGQWNDPNAVKVAPGDERPGDGVYFVGSLSGKNAGPPPGHCGIYIGGGIFINYYSQGKPAASDNLANRPDYMGARRWLKVQSQTGGGGGTGAAPPTGGSGGAKKKKRGAAGFDLPVNLQTAIAQAQLTKGTADDLKALRAAQAYIQAHIGGFKGQKKLEALQALKGVNDDIDQITTAANAKRLSKEKAAAAKEAAAEKAQLKQRQDAWKAHLQRLQDIVESQKSVFESAFESVASAAMDAFDRETQRGIDALNAQYGAETPEEARLRQFREARDAEQRAQDRADAMSIEDPVERNKRLRELDLQDQEDALQKAADASREQRDRDLAAAQTSYQDDRAARRDALDGWLKDQETRLETGKTQWDTFWADLKTKADLAGGDVGSAFWDAFNQAGRAASGGLSEAQKAAIAAGDTSMFTPGSLGAQGYFLLNPPSFDKGGIVPGALGQPSLIVAHGGETVTPPGRGGGNVYQFSFPNYMGDRAELERFVKSAVKRANNKGDLLLADLR